MCISYLKYPLSTRNLEEIFTLRNLFIDHSTINRWIIKYSEIIDKNYKKRSLQFSKKYYIDETYVKVKGVWMYLYRAIDRNNKTIDFYFSSNRSKKAAKRFFQKMFKKYGLPDEVTMDKSGSNLSAIAEINKKLKQKGQKAVKVRQYKYLNNRIEQDHKAIKKKTSQIQTFKSYFAAKFTLAGIEVVHANSKRLKRSGNHCVQNLINSIQSLVA